MMSGELVMLVFASVGIAASLYGQYLYWHNSHQRVRSSEPRRSGTDGARRLRLVSMRNQPQGSLRPHTSVERRL